MLTALHCLGEGPFRPVEEAVVGSNPNWLISVAVALSLLDS